MAEDDHAEVRRPRRGGASLRDLTMIVRIHGRPADVRVFTDDEETDAQQYATRNSGVLERFPARPE